MIYDIIQKYMKRKAATEALSLPDSKPAMGNPLVSDDPSEFNSKDIEDLKSGMNTTKVNDHMNLLMSKGNLEALNALLQSLKKDGLASKVMKLSDSRGAPPLVAAAVVCRNPKAVDLLLKWGADPTTRDRSGHDLYWFLEHKDAPEQIKSAVYDILKRHGY